MAEEAELIRRRDNPSPVTMRDVLAVFFRQRKLFVRSFAAVFFAALLYGIFAPSYRAEMLVLVTHGRSDPVVSAQSNAGSEYPREEVSEEELNSEGELLQDATILKKVVETTGLSKPSWTAFLPGGETAEEATARGVRRLAQQIRVEPIKKSDLIHVRYEAGNPERAAQVLNKLASVYVERHAQVHRPAGGLQFFDQQTSESREKLLNAETRLREFTRNTGVASAALERDIALQRINEDEVAYRRLRLDVEQTQRRAQALETRMPQLPERTTTELRVADNPQLMEKLKSRLLELELKRTELLTKFEPTYRLVQEVDTQIAETRQMVAAETLRPLHEETTNRNPDREWAQAELEKAQVELAALRARAALAGAQLASSRKRVGQLAEHTLEQQDLLRTAKANEDAYLLYLRKREEARIGNAMDERGILNVVIAQPPVTPALPVHSAWFFAVVGVGAAAGVSTGLAFARDFLDPMFHGPDEVVTCLGSPVLASLPREAA
jgi:succinoglycan biosynthesis transport protein ExoP